MENAINRAEPLGGTLYRPLVRTLFADTATMVVGVAASSVAAFLTAIEANSLILFVCGAAMLLVGAFRLTVNLLFRRATHNSQLTSSAAHKWEALYTIGGVATAACLGFWCFISMSDAGSQFATFTSCVVTFANLVGVCSRNFPFKRLLNWQLLMIGGFVVAGGFSIDAYHAVLSLLVLPFVFSVRVMADNQRNTLFAALFERRKAEKLASQVDHTLNNVPQGICMFDASRRLEVCNQHVAKAFGLDRKQLSRSRPEELMKKLVDQNLISEGDADIITQMLSSSSTALSTYRYQFGTKRNRTCKIMINPMANGGIVATFADITHQVSAASQIDHLARYDRLTGLVNRDEFQVLVGRELMQRSVDQQCSILLINLDKFKQFNETLGHATGDIILCEMTRRILSTVGRIATCARYGGDEFAVLVRSHDNADLAQAMADQIIERLSEPYTVGDDEIRIGCTIGLSHGWHPADSAEQLLKQADMALSSAKSTARGTWTVFNYEMSEKLEQRRQLENDLSHALERGEFEVFYQPLVSVEKRKVTTCEALLRWNHPKNGMVSPAIFVPLAEEMGLITEIGAWVMRQACIDCESWPGNVRVAVNLSAVQFTQSDIIADVTDALNHSGLDAERLELEITESLMLSDVRDTVACLDQFKQMGVRISLDDFGTGYSSLSYMNELPLDKVKIDRSFVLDLKGSPKSLTLVKAISTLGQQLGLSVVVEGIEDAPQLSTLLQHTGVTELQGYYFSKPCAASAIRVLCDKTSAENRKMIGNLSSVMDIAA